MALLRVAGTDVVMADDAAVSRVVSVEKRGLEWVSSDGLFEY